MKTKHNKKRNSAFIFEALVQELTKGVLEKDEKKKIKVTSILKEHFGKGTLVYEELSHYKALYETYGLELHTADKLLQETRYLHHRLNKKKLFAEQSALIKKISKNLDKGVFSNFVPNYKDLATIYQLFNSRLASKERLLMEENIIVQLVASNKEKKQEANLKPIDGIVYKSFVQRFNNHYSSLLEEQKRFLGAYVSSFADDGIAFKLYLNEEIARLKKTVTLSAKLEEVREDEAMAEKTKKVINILEGYKNRDFGKTDIKTLLKIQSLANEINS